MAHTGFHQTDNFALTALSTLAKTANASISIKSNTSPDIVINLADLLEPGSDPSKSVSSSNQSSLNWIRPQIIIRSIGGDTVFSPYGEPNSLGFIGLAFGILLMGLLGAKVALTMCRYLGKR